MDPGEWDEIWRYRDMRYSGSPCVEGLSTGPRVLGRHTISLQELRYEGYG